MEVSEWWLPLEALKTRFGEKIRFVNFSFTGNNLWDSESSISLKESEAKLSEISSIISNEAFFLN